MPTYEYACRDCGHRFDAVQSIHDDALTDCPECGGTVRRVVAAVGVQFKGSGFYRTDNRPAGKSAGASGSASSNADGGSSAEAKSDKKAGATGREAATASKSGETSSGAGKAASGGKAGGGQASSGN